MYYSKSILPTSDQRIERSQTDESGNLIKWTF